MRGSYGNSCTFAAMRLIIHIIQHVVHYFTVCASAGLPVFGAPCTNNNSALKANAPHESDIFSLASKLASL